MPKKASTHGASAPSKSKTARSKAAKAKSKDKAAPRKEARKEASEAASKPTAAAARQGGNPRRSRSRSLSPDDRPNPRDSPASTKDPTPSQDAPSQDAPADDTASSEAKAASTSSPAKNLTLDEGKARAQAAKAASSKRADEGAAAAKKRVASDSPTSEPSIANGSRSLFDSSDEKEEERAVSEPQEISDNLDEQQERYQADQLQDARAPPTPVYPRGYYPPDAGSGSPMFLEHLKALVVLTMGALHVAPISSSEETVFPVWGYPWVQPENTTTQTQAENLNFTVQELKELREDRLLSYVLDQRDLRIKFAHLIANRQFHSVMEGLRQQSKSSAQGERGYGSVNPGTVHRKAAKKPRTTYAPAISTQSRSSGSHEFCDEGYPRHFTRALPLLDYPLHMVVELAVPAKEGRRSFRTRLSTRLLLSLILLDPRDSVGSLLSDEVRQLRDRVYAIEIALGLGPGGQAASQAGKPGALEVLRQERFGRSWS
ncbi:Hypothetical protein PHPALM_17921 [Phytophthora palmivora]|uniref:ATP-binding cassette (ABC) Superfamily n=1 Tax=Phytophthora palmivora TaxID=4796 RepID=A0A2P4XL12_9STRA|nr:Hypothetical protein PHPALM_17921 [Phytophthora palmivora]